MPHRHSIKVYVAGGHYHIYNRGVEKRDVFLDDQDYRVFLHLLKYYLSPIKQGSKHPLSEIPDYHLIRPRPLANLSQEVNLIAYCLMPNHFHLLIKQITSYGMPKLLRRLSTTYAVYFNKRHNRVGYLFQGNYKAALIEDDSYLLHLSRYIHLNPAELTRMDLVSYPYSSYAHYLGHKKADWLKPGFVLSFFNNPHYSPFLHKFPSYKDFVEVNTEDPREAISDFSID